MCGAGLSGKPSSTIGFEKRFNPGLSIAATRTIRCARWSREIPPRPAEMDEIVAANTAPDAGTGGQRRARMEYSHGIRRNLAQFLHQLLQVLLVGLTLGMMRTVVPALAESEFDVPKGSFLLLVAFVVAFGFVKGALNFAAGRLSERIGRKHVLLIGWLAAVPIPFMIGYGHRAGAGSSPPPCCSASTRASPGR